MKKKKEERHVAEPKKKDEKEKKINRKKNEKIFDWVSSSPLLSISLPFYSSVFRWSSLSSSL